jgi:hypothetical protein
LADNTLTTWAPFLYDLQGKVWDVFSAEAVLLAELSGFSSASNNVDGKAPVKRITQEMDGNRTVFSGKQARQTIVLAGLQGGGNPTETSTWNVPHALSTTSALINLVRFLEPFSITVDVERDSFDNSSAAAVTEMVKQTRIALAKLENLEFLGDGTGLQASITDGATSLTTTVATTSNFDVLVPGSVWDILTRATGADPGQGLRRKIASVVESTGVITWDTASQASDGGSGNIVHTSADGIYVPGTLAAGITTPGSQTAQGLEQIAAITGTFENIAKGSVPQWQGTDGRAGDTTSVPLSDQLLDAAVRRGRRAGLGTWDFAIGDPAVIDLYKQGKYAQMRYNPQDVTLVSGYSGIVYEGADKPFPLIKDPAAMKTKLKLIDKASLQLYGDQPGPSFLEDDGAMFRRFTRTLAKEADMLDRVQLGAMKCNTLVFLNNLAQAS